MSKGLYVYLVRHGHSQSNMTGCYCGDGDVALAPEGYEDARRAGQILQSVRFDRIYASTLSRAQETCRTALPGATFETDARLNEISVGSLRGVMPADAEARYGETHGWARAHRDFTAFGGENYEMHFGRVAGFMRELEHSGQEGNIAVFCHDGTIKAMFDYAMGILAARTRVRVENGSVCVLLWTGSQWQLERWNVTDRL